MSDSDYLSRRAMNAVLGFSVAYAIYPVMAAATTVGTVVTAGASAYGAVKELIAVNTITTDYWVCAADFDTTTNFQLFRIDIGTGVATVFTTSRMQVQLDTTAATANLTRFMAGPFPAWVPGNMQLVARATGTGAKVVGVSVTTATGL
jgi:hypothetical protein